jgi:hypothetical protein
MTRTPEAWVPCVCWWRDLILDKVPAILRCGEDALGPEVLASAPWPITEDRFEQGEGRDWTWYRRQVWWSMAHAIYDAHKSSASPKLPRVLVVETTRLRDIHFGEDAEFKTMRALLDYDLLVLVGGTEPPMMRATIEDLTESLLRMRILYGRPSWGYKLAPYLARLRDTPGANTFTGPVTLGAVQLPAVTIGPDGKPRIW